MERQDQLRADAALVLVTIAWGSTFIVNAEIIGHEPPLAFLTLRFAIAAAILYVLSLGRRRAPGLIRDSVILGGLLALGMASQIIGQTETSASKAAFITGLSVVLTPVVGVFRTRRSPGLANLAGVALASSGFLLLAWPQRGGAINRGDVMIFLCAVCFAVYFVENAERAPRHDVFVLTAAQIALVAIIAAALSFLVRRTSLPLGVTPFEHQPLTWTRSFVLAIVYMGTVATVGTFSVQTWAQTKVSATHAAIIFALEPVWTAIFAAIWLGERLRTRDFAGGALVLAGIVVSELPWPAFSRAER